MANGIKSQFLNLSGAQLMGLDLRSPAPFTTGGSQRRLGLPPGACGWRVDSLIIHFMADLHLEIVPWPHFEFSQLVFSFCWAGSSDSNPGGQRRDLASRRKIDPTPH